MENTRIVEQQRKTTLKAEEIQLFKESFVIVPYQASGFLNYTNNGYNADNINPNDFETFKRVWTGNDACVISWKNSVSLVQQDDDTMKINFQLGEVFCGAIQTNDSENRIQNDMSFSEYKAQDIKKTINFYVNSHFEITDYYLLMFYKIPEYSGSTLYRLSNIERDFVGKQLVGYVLTFETINQDLANTGRAKQQNIMPNSPGQGYLECVVKQQEWYDNLPQNVKDSLVEGKDYYKFYDRYITADFEKIKNRPVSKICVKLFGTNILSCLVCEGRPVFKGDTFENWKPQRLLFPIKFGVPTTPNLYATQNNINNFYFGNFSPTLLYWKDLMSDIKDNLTPVNKWNYQGWLEYDYSKLQDTNPQASDSGGTSGYKYTLYDNDWTPELEVKSINNTGVYGSKQTYNIGGVKTIENHLWDNFWTQKQIKTLPINLVENLSYGNTVLGGLALIGSGLFGIGKVNPFLNILNIGIGTILGVVGLAFTLQQKLKKRLQSFRGLIPASMLDFNNDLFGSQQGKIPFNILNSNNNTDTPNEIFFDGSTINTSFTAELTDRFTTSKVPGTSLSTLNIGQTTFENGDNILSDGTQYLVEGIEELIPSKDTYEGYIIDSFKIQTIFNGDISVEFLDYNDEVIWSGIYQSEGKWTKSMREVWTEKNTSVFGRENSYFTNPIPYPKPIPNIDGNLVELDKLTDFNVLQDYAISGSNDRQNYANWISSANSLMFERTNLSTYDMVRGSYYLKRWYINGTNSYDVNISTQIFDFDNNEQNITTWKEFSFYYPQIQMLINLNWNVKNMYLLYTTANNFNTNTTASNFNYTINNDYFYISDKELDVEYDITEQMTNFENVFVENRKAGIFWFHSVVSSTAQPNSPSEFSADFYKTTPFKQVKIRFYTQNNKLYLNFIGVKKQQELDGNKVYYPKIVELKPTGRENSKHKYNNCLYGYENSFLDDRILLNLNIICRKS